jgi:thioredoxin-dependent peroxiredoxin
MPPLNVGDRVPDITLQAHDGSTVRLADMIGKRPVVLFFYPKDDTPICTKEACAFRDAYETFSAAGAEVIGISSDSGASHRAFAARHKLPFLLASDADGSLRKAFGVPKTLGLFPGRVTYVIDRDGIVRLVFSAQLASQDHVTKALATVRAIDGVAPTP